MGGVRYSEVNLEGFHRIGSQIVCPPLGGVRYSACPLFRGFTVKRSFGVLDHKTLPKIFKAMVRPHVERGPHFKLVQQVKEKVQKQATSLIPNIKDLPYSERLEHLKLPSFAYRRRRGDMLQTYKIISDKININKNSFSNSELQLGEGTGRNFIIL